MQVQINVKGHLDLFWQEWLEGLQIAHLENGTSLLTGILQDQAALYGVLWKLRDQGIALLAFKSSSCLTDAPPARLEERVNNGQRR